MNHDVCLHLRQALDRLLVRVGRVKAVHRSSEVDIAANFDISWPAISQNLRVLCDAGLITQRKAGHFRLYQANRDAIGPLEPFLRAMWAADLDQLRQVVERDQSERSR